MPRYRTNRHVNGTSSPNGVNGSHSSAKNKKKKNASNASNDDLHFVANGSHGDEHVVEAVFEVDEHAPDPDVEQDDEFEFEQLPEEGSAESHIDDPIRMYLMQMGEIPMLSRDDEMSSARADRRNARTVPPLAAGQRLCAARGGGAVGKGAARASCGWTARSRSRSRTRRRRSARSSGSRRTWPRSGTCCALNQADFRVAIDKQAAQ